MTVDTTTRWLPQTQSDRDMVRRELNAIISSHHFRNSKRYPSLLRYVVDKTLDGHSDQLKERTLGVEVFDRPPDYDTNADPVVRFSAGEIRKRIAQFYHENGKDSLLQIDLPLGSYVPEFKLRPIPPHPKEYATQDQQHSYPRIPDPTVAQPDVLTRTDQPTIHGISSLTARFANKPYLWWSAFLVLAIASVGLYIVTRGDASTPSDKMWGPLLKSPGSVLFVIGNGPRGALFPATTPQTNLAGQVHGPYNHISFNEAVALSRLADVMTKHSKPYQVKEADLATLQDMRDRSVVLIGAYNNLWTMRLTDSLRFHFQKDGVQVHIVDTKNPENRDWVVDYTHPYSTALFDYAIIARYVDPTTNGGTLILAGIGAFGTQAASESVANPQDLEKLLSKVPSGWENKNMEIVIRTAVINGEAGPPTLLAVTTW